MPPKKTLHQTFIKKYFDPGRTPNPFFWTKKKISKTHYHTHFYGNNHFFPPYHTPKKREHKKTHFFIITPSSTTGGNAKNQFEQKVSQMFFIIKSRKIYDLCLIQKISRKLSFHFLIKNAHFYYHKLPFSIFHHRKIKNATIFFYHKKLHFFPPFFRRLPFSTTIFKKIS